jgi:hypothetical protein
MMGLGRLFNWGDKGLDIAAKRSVDVDQLVKLAQEGQDAQLRAYMAELAVPTIPWVDALHKMGRQIQIYMLLFLGWYSTWTGKPLDPIAWGVLGGAVGVYHLVKGPVAK